MAAVHGDPRPYPPGLRKDLSGSPQSRLSKAAAERFIAFVEKRLRRGGRGDAPEPVHPTNPNSLSGGAAASAEPDGV